MSDIKATFTIDELLAELAGPEKNLEGYRTTMEWAELLGVYEKRMRELLHLAQRQGKLLVDRAYREALDGRMQNRPVYAFKLKVADSRPLGKEV